MRESQLLQRLIIPGLEGRKKAMLVEWKVLRERDGHEPLLGINLTIRRRRAVPAELSGR